MINGIINRINAVINCLIVDERFISIINHIAIDNLMPILKMSYLSLIMC
jgi:hypothetical protein